MDRLRQNRDKKIEPHGAIIVMSSDDEENDSLDRRPVRLSYSSKGNKTRIPLPCDTTTCSSSVTHRSGSTKNAQATRGTDEVVKALKGLQDSTPEAFRAQVEKMVNGSHETFNVQQPKATNDTRNVRNRATTGERRIAAVAEDRIGNPSCHRDNRLSNKANSAPEEVIDLLSSDDEEMHDMTTKSTTNPTSAGSSANTHSTAKHNPIIGKNESRELQSNGFSPSMVASSNSRLIHQPTVRRKGTSGAPPLTLKTATREDKLEGCRARLNPPTTAKALHPSVHTEKPCPVKPQKVDNLPEDSTRKSFGETGFCDGDDESDSSFEQEIKAATAEELKSQCWKCSVQLRSANDGEFCCYAMHLHPLLRVPTCSVCSREVAAVQADEDDSSAQEPESCSGCAERDVDLFICDGCNRGMCTTCLVQANGGGSAAVEQVLQLATYDIPWYCPCCKPTPELSSLQDQTRHYQERSSGQRDVDEVIRELAAVEEKMRQCEEQELPENAAKLRTSIRQELMDSDPRCTEGSNRLERLVESEMEAWNYRMQSHEANLSDLASSLMEELEGFEVDLKKYYQSSGLISKPSNDARDVEPEWKKAADKAVEQRWAEEKLKADEDDDSTTSDSCALEDGEVEDLWDDDEFPEERVDNKAAAQWRSSKRVVSRRKLEACKRLEDERYKELNVRVKILDEAADIEESREEERKSYNPAARVRRDDLVYFQRRKQAMQERSLLTASTRRPANAKMLFEANCSQLTNHRLGTQISQGASEVSGSWEGSIDSGGIFASSSLVLSDSKDLTERLRDIAIARPLAEKLKTHQKEGIQFMFDRVFADLSYLDENEAFKGKDEISGCILAHNMGLGKSFSSIALIHSLLGHPSLKPLKLVHTILLVVPVSRIRVCDGSIVPTSEKARSTVARPAGGTTKVNTLTNWVNEFDRWVGGLSPFVEVFNLNEVEKSCRLKLLERWGKRGGVLLVTEQTFMRCTKNDPHATKYLQLPGPDALFIDEAHTMLKKKTNEIYKALDRVNTRRRVCLTGSPFQNNLCEYFRLLSYVKPDIFNLDINKFVKEFVDPIQKGLVSDATLEEKARTEELFSQIERIANPYIHRRDHKILFSDLPPLQEVVIFVRQTRCQQRLYARFKKQKALDQGFSDNFFKTYQSLRPIHNHPACLLTTRQAVQVARGPSKNLAAVPVNTVKKPELPIKLEQDTVLEKQPSLVENAAEKAESRSKIDLDAVIDLLTDSEEDVLVDTEIDSRKWWMPIADKYGMDSLKRIQNGYKVVLLLHLLVHASMLNEKVVVFSLSLPTLDFLEEVLAKEDWQNLVPSLAQSGLTAGGWKSGRDYLRFDGDASATERGNLVSQFNNDSNSYKVILISCQAGGLGINLASASRVVLFDSHFNPAVTSQAIFRCYRYGQERPTFVYRLLTQGTMEEKIYNKAINKANVGNRVIDSKSFLRQFSKTEVEDLEKNFTWVQCDACQKWRMLPPYIEGDELPDKWYCYMNKDKMNNNCKDKERDQKWYEKRLEAGCADEAVPFSSPTKGGTGDDVSTSTGALSAEDKEKMLEDDAILQELLKVSSRKESKKSSLIADYKFQGSYFDQSKASNPKANFELVGASGPRGSTEADCLSESATSNSNAQRKDRSDPSFSLKLSKVAPKTSPTKSKKKSPKRSTVEASKESPSLKKSPRMTASIRRFPQSMARTKLSSTSANDESTFAPCEATVNNVARKLTMEEGDLGQSNQESVVSSADGPKTEGRRDKRKREPNPQPDRGDPEFTVDGDGRDSNHSKRRKEEKRSKFSWLYSRRRRK